MPTTKTGRLRATLEMSRSMPSTISDQGFQVRGVSILINFHFSSKGEYIHIIYRCVIDEYVCVVLVEPC